MKYKCPDCNNELKENNDIQYVEKIQSTTIRFYKFDFKNDEETTEIIDTEHSNEYDNSEYYYICGYCDSEALELSYFKVDE